MNSTTSRPEAKRWRVLRALLDGGSFNRFEAERQLHDHVLHTTVAFLEGMGVRIDRQDESVPGYQGIATRVKRYRLAQESRARAAELLALAEHERRAA